MLRGILRLSTTALSPLLSSPNSSLKLGEEPCYLGRAPGLATDAESGTGHRGPKSAGEASLRVPPILYQHPAHGGSTQRVWKDYVAILSAGRTAGAHAVARVRGRCVGRLAQPVQRRRWRGATVGLLTMLIMGVTTSGAQTLAPREYQIKAAFLYNFTKFIEWPPEAFPSPSAAIKLCVLGEDPFGDDLEQTIRGKLINGRTVVVQRFQGMQGLDGCHVLFVSTSEQRHLSQILESLKGRSVLTVGEGREFAKLGVMIFFIEEGNKIRLGIDDDAAKRAGLGISPELLRVAEAFRGKPD